LGSGTTARVSQILGRNSIGFDINPDYVDMAISRLKEEFSGFDSIDPRKERAPKDQPKTKLATAKQA
ncbi:MAG: hypothetical protein JKY12_04140, partial [Sneathiella sp.]|nr:hypothetical protein [Sneathiella sp.]